jgi:hypothetical protein|tara:strand:- start:3571 stop:4782 length:1212 start_codon:yes stop_codon:yes gene_type:complete
MAFSLMSFLGGAASGGSQVLDERRKQAARDKETTESRQWQIATEARADARARKLKRQSDKDSASEAAEGLRFLGYDDEYIADITKGGKFAVAEATRYGQLAREQGKDINTIWGATGNLAEAGEVVEGISSTAIKSDATPQAMGFQKDKLKELLNPELEDKVQASLDSAYAVAIQKSMFAKTPEEKQKYSTRADNLLLKIKQQAGEEDNGRAFSEGTINANINGARRRASEGLGYGYTKEGNIISGFTGKVAEYNISELIAAQDLYSINLDTTTKQPVDAMMHSAISKMSVKANNNLKQYGRRMSNGNFNVDFESNKLKGATVETITGEDGKPTYQISSYTPISSNDLMTSAKKGEYTIGDVILVREAQEDGSSVVRVKVYTGLQNYSSKHNMFIDSGTLDTSQ